MPAEPAPRPGRSPRSPSPTPTTPAPSTRRARLRGPTIGGSHRRRRPGLVHEDEAPGLDRLDLLGEDAPLLLDLACIPLGGVWGFLLPRQAELLQGAADDHPAAGGAHLLAERLERGVGRLLDEATELLEGVAIEGGGDAAGVGPGLI